MGSPRDPGRVGDRQAPQDPPCAAARFFREGAQPPSRRAPASTGRRGVATGRRGIGCQVRRRRGQPAAGSAGRPDRRGRPASHLSPATVTGEIQLIAAHITSWLDCSGATLTNEGVRALTGDRLTVDGDLFLTRARRAAHLGRPVPIPIEFGPASTPAELSPSMQLCAGLHGIIDGIPCSNGYATDHVTEPTGRLQRRVEGPVTDPLELAADAPLTDEEAGYVEAARAANTLRGYRSDWAEFTGWCGAHGLDPLPPAPGTVTGYLTELARAGAKVGTMSRRLSAIRFAARLRNQVDPTANARVVAVWEGIRRTHGAPPEQAATLMPPELFDVLAACPQVKKRWKTRGRASEPDLAGLRDTALLLVGFVAALRRSELADLKVDEVAEHTNGAVLTLPRSKTNQTGEQTELVVLPRAGHPARCPVTTLQAWLAAAGITGGPVFRPVSTGNRALPGRCTRSRSTPWCRPRSPGPGSTPPRTARTACGPASSPTPTCAAPPTGPSPTR